MLQQALTCLPFFHVLKIPLKVGPFLSDIVERPFSIRFIDSVPLEYHSSSLGTDL